jgi:hypothetical protein
MGELVELQAGEWALWRTMAVRAAGFPADGLAVFGEEESAGLAGLAGHQRFREALTWQNQDALGNALDRLSAAASGSTHRRRLETVASYWQRYCAKNDTIGFFGPLGWGQLADDGPAVVAEPGAELLAARMTRFEVWAIDALAAVLAEDPGIRRWIPPRRHPARVPADLDEAEKQVYQRCDGRPAFEAGPVELVAKLADQGLLVWALRVPVGPHPERELRAQLEAIGDPAVRARCLEALDRLEAARAAVAAAAGDADALGRALDKLGQVFESVTRVAAHRRAGEMYAGRSVCYEDCRRNLTLRLGPDIVAELARVLVPVLAGARWYCGEVAEVGRAVIAEAVAEARAERGATRSRSSTCGAASYRSSCRPRDGVNCLPLWQAWRRSQPNCSAAGASCSPVTSTLWPSGPKRCSAAPVRPGHGRAFTAPISRSLPPAKTPSTGASSPLSSATSIPAARPSPSRSSWKAIPSPTRCAGSSAVTCPARGCFGCCRATWAASAAGSFPGMRQRPTTACSPPRKPACRPVYRSVALAELRVDDDADGPVIVTGGGKPIAPLLHAFEHPLFIAGIRSYIPFAPAPHAPRITAGRAVLRREMWTLNGTDIGWVHRKQEAHSAARQWAMSLDMPRRVFALAAGEAKPIYVDFDSRALVSILGRQIRAAGQAPVRFSEMLPDPDHLWLTDAQGNRYTSELRLTAVDLTHP